MNTLIPILGIIALIFGGIVFFQSRNATGQYGNKEIQEVVTPTTASITNVSETNTIAVPAANQQSLVEAYLKAISEKKIPEAIAMMTKKSVPDDATKQAWGVQFNAFNKLVVVSIKPSMQEEWNDEKESYLVTIDVEMSDSAAQGPIPYFGYENGTNTRWLTLEKEEGVWKVAGISTGP